MRADEPAAIAIRHGPQGLHYLSNAAGKYGIWLVYVETVRNVRSVK